MPTWADGGREPPRPGYYAEEAERALDVDSSPSTPASARMRERAQVYATLELAAAVERSGSELTYALGELRR